MTEWFNTVGKRDVLEVEPRDGSWYVAGRSKESAVRCLAGAFGTEPDDEPERRRIRATVSSYKRGTGDRPDVLFLTDVVPALDAETGSDPPAEGVTTPGDEAGDGTGEDPSSVSSLERIARERIGDREFRGTDEESLIAGAQRRASDRHRAPAIDPRLQDERTDICEDDWR
ncbi:hypothetical protein [Haloglomus litoreum]|uniref:hypothetical protein n=1 Tax=Haloglomus litoreum TaxID=3034026 RepID=UPI0023E84455|nr:hypothetical protein [Haloglomus sp. DT116]